MGWSLWIQMLKSFVVKIETCLPRSGAAAPSIYAKTALYPVTSGITLTIPNQMAQFPWRWGDLFGPFHVPQLCRLWVWYSSAPSLNVDGNTLHGVSHRSGVDFYGGECFALLVDSSLKYLELCYIIPLVILTQLQDLNFQMEQTELTNAIEGLLR